MQDKRKALYGSGLTAYIAAERILSCHLPSPKQSNSCEVARWFQPQASCRKRPATSPTLAIRF